MPSTSGFSPEQHRAIRRHLALIPAYVWLAYVWPVFFAQLPLPSRPERGNLVRDFLHFYTQGLITREHDAKALYDIDAMAAVADRAVAHVEKRAYPPAYGPQVGLIFSPLSRIDYLSALYVWLGATFVGYVLCLFLVWRDYSPLHLIPWPVAVMALGAPGLHFTFSFGQASLIGLFCFTALWLALRRGRMFVAGLAVGALAYKPQLGIVAAFVFVLCGEWRVVFGALVAVAVQFLASLAYWGPAIFMGYVSALTRLPALLTGMEPHKDLAQSLRAVFMDIGLAPGLGIGLAVAATAVVISGATLAWRAGQSLTARFVALTAASLLANPHFYAYDLMVASPALLVAWGQALDSRDHTLGLAVGCVYAAPIVSMLMTPDGAIPWTLLALAFLLAAAGRPAAKAS